MIYSILVYSLFTFTDGGKSIDFLWLAWGFVNGIKSMKMAAIPLNYSYQGSSLPGTISVRLLGSSIPSETSLDSPFREYDDMSETG